MKIDDKFNEDEEKIMNEIRKNTSNIQVPDSLSPENMMKRIKESGVKEKTAKKTYVKKHRWNIGMAFVSVAVAFCVIMGTLAVKNNLLFNNDKATKTSVNDISNGQGDEEVNKELSGIDNISRDEAVNIFKRQILMAYVGHIKGSWYVGSSNGATFGGSLDGEVTENTIADDSTTNGISNGSAEEYYENNDQVEGVIESDIVRTDGKYIYSLDSDSEKISIIKIQDGTMEKLSDIDYSGAIKEKVNDYYISERKMYVNQKKLAVLLQVTEYEELGEEDSEDNEEIYYEDICWNYNRYYKDMVYVIEYDISDINLPQEVGVTTVEGCMLSSRMVDNYLYIITKKYNEYNGKNSDSIWKRLYYTEENVIPKINGKEVNEENMYVCGEENNIDSIQIVCSLDMNNNMEVISECATLVGGGEVYVSNDNIYVMSTEYIYSEEYEDDSVSIKTYINKYHYEDGKILASVSGEVEGDVLNQFSVDEKDGYFRMVTTNQGENYVYILDSSLNVVGSLKGIAENEYVRSVRFMGDRVYFVTFRQTDPLFVADLSDVTNPVILDELKVTGFSSYLHNWSENLLLGIGSEATEDGMVTGTKISMFSIENDELKEINRLVIKNAYASDMDTDYKNILVDGNKNIIGLGIDKIGTISTYCYEVYKYQDNEIQNILEYSNECINNDGYYGTMYRGLYVGDYLYIITLGEGIQSINLNDMSYVQYLDLNS